MTKVLFLFTIVVLFLNAEDTKKEYPALAANVINIVQNDVLNIRENPDHKSKKVGSYILGSGMMIDYCQKVGRSTWCKIYPEVNVNYGGREYEAGSGWVNAYYLKYRNSGYIDVVNRKSHCDLVLKCEKRDNDTKCLVVSYEAKGEWISRKFLRPQTDSYGDYGEITQENFDHNGTWCFNHVHYTMPIYDQKEKLKVFSKKSKDKAYQKVIELLSYFIIYDSSDDISPLIHPKKGVIITDMVRFGDKDEQHFTQKSFIKELSDNKKILWGYTYAKGDPIRESLSGWLMSSHKDIMNITKIDTLFSFKGFREEGYKKLKAYEVYWINKKSDTKEHDWLGLVVILAEYQGEWYIVGLIRDRWTV